ncbi:Disease resistance protein RPP8 [Sesamum alatum]|uniref:Disease resistance protein RPP8 n=1 Tax=Sesamum alatum TaxID=300844 RepID=A0AAE1Z3V1_9LAMI|nr:Disease resistance protein RPP8 [Sesamum alatum]
MAVAAYASLLSLAHVLDQIQHPLHRHRLSLDTEQLRSLQEKVKDLQDFLELHLQRKISQEVEDLARQIPVVAYEAEDVIDSHVVYVGTSQDRSDHHDAAALSSFYQDLDGVIQKIDSIIKELMGVVKEEPDDVREPKPVADSLPTNASSSRVLPSSGENSTMVGFDDRLVQIIDELTRDESDLKILPIVGMGGIGKTTLARNVFGHAYIVDRFDIRIWFTISQQYSVQEILLGLVNDGEKKRRSGTTSDALGERLHKRLFGRRYLIVMDDVWSNKAWDDLKQFFPNNRNGSRVLVTTRLSNLAVSLGSQNPYLMDFLDEENCWNLLCEKVFGHGGCPYSELKQIGKNIAKSCRGLPLALVVIDGLLAKSNMTREYWKSIAKNVNSFANSEDDEYCLKVLSLTYNNLPIHLKPCFLYMRVFPEDTETKVSELIKLWVAEGFIKPANGKTLEEAAAEYLKDLIDMNLIFICEQKASGEIRSIGIHDLLRDLCLRESDRENFIRIPRSQLNYTISQDQDECYLCNNQAFSLQERIDVFEILVGSRSTSVATALVCKACKCMYPDLMKLRWVKVFYKPGGKFLQHTKLRYIMIESENDDMTDSEKDIISPSTLPLLWNLQTLYIDSQERQIFIPSEIWEMPQLRHIDIMLAVLPDPMDAQEATTILDNLQTLSMIHNFRCTKEVVKRIPNLKILRCSYFDHLEDWSYYCLHNLSLLHKLESFTFTAQDFLLENITFPVSLKKLILSYCKIPWKDMTIIGSLPNLEVLKLYNHAFEGPEWNPVEGEFLRLKVLLIKSCELVWWTAEDTHFPNLEVLSLRVMRDLKEIPSSIGDIATLKSIWVQYCSEPIRKSAQRILEEQRSNGNESLQFYLNDTVEIRVEMDCDGCERKVKNAVCSLRGVKAVDINRKQSRITVSGYLDPYKVLKSVKNTGKEAEFWPYSPPYNRLQIIVSISCLWNDELVFCVEGSTVAIKVEMDCERKVKNTVINLRGVKSMEVDREQSRVTVTGYVDPNKVLKSLKNTGKEAEFWPE